MPKLYSPDGKQVIEVNTDAEIQEGLKAGFGINSADPITMTTGAGTSIPIATADEYLKASDAGAFTLTEPEIARRQAQEEYGGVGTTIAGMGAAALSGASLGLSDVAGREIGGEEYAKFRTGTEQVSPYLMGGSELGGAIAPILLSGGTATPEAGAGLLSTKTGAGLLAKIAGAAPTSLLTRVGEAAGRLVPEAEATTGLLGRVGLGAGKLGVSGAIQGAGFGAGEALHEAAIAPGGNYDGLAEKLMAGVGWGALSGGLLGAGMGLGSELVHKAIGSIPEKLSEKGAIHFATEELGISAGEVRKLEEKAPGRFKEVMRSILGAQDIPEGTSMVGRATEEPILGIPKGKFTPRSPAEAITELERLRGEAGQQLGDLRKAVNEINDESIKARMGVDRYNLAKSGLKQPTEEEIRAMPIEGGMSKALDAHLSEILRQSPEYQEKFAAIKAFADDVKGWKETYKDAIPTLRKRVDKSYNEVSGLIDKYNKGEEVTLEDMFNTRKQIDHVLYARGIPPKTSSQLEEIRGKLDNAITNETDRILTAYEKNPVAISKKLTELPDVLKARNAAGLGYMEPAPPTTADYVELKKRYGNYSDAIRMLKGSASREEGQSILKLLKPKGELGTIGAIAGHVTGGIKGVALGGLGGKYLGKAATWGYEKYGRSLLANTLWKIAKKEAQTSNLISEGIKTYLGVGRVAITKEVAESTVKPTDLKSYHEVLDRAQKVAAASKQAQIPGVTPNVNAALAKQANIGANYLMKTAPTKPHQINSNSLTPQHVKPEPNPVQLKQFARRVQIVDKPLSIINEMNNGTLAREHVETLQAVYPQLYEQIRGEVAKQLMDSEHPADFYKTKQIEILLHIPNMRPESVQATQAMFQAAAQPKTPRQFNPQHGPQESAVEFSKTMNPASAMLEEGRQV
jgi:hypothetical protein